MPAICIRCRRPLPREEEPDGVVLTLDGPEMLEAIQRIDRATLEPEQLQVVEELEGELCPACGRAR